MKLDISEYIAGKLNDNPELRQRVKNLHRELTVPAKTTLLEAGRVARNLYSVKQGCVRLWFNEDGKDITLQFFREGESVASIESFLENTPSLYSLETLEPTTVWVYDKADLLRLTEEIPALKADLPALIAARMTDYTRLFLSRIKDTPQQRYENLLKEHPEIIQRVPQHYIASYLGITPVSLSRIRNRK